MSFDRAELLRRRRCLAVQIAIALGVFLLVTERNWIVSAVVAAGIVVLAGLWWRICRHGTAPPGSRERP